MAYAALALLEKSSAFLFLLELVPSPDKAFGKGSVVLYEHDGQVCHVDDYASGKNIRNMTAVIVHFHDRQTGRIMI